MTRRFDAVVFDFGGVLATSPFDHIEAMGRSMGAGDGVFAELVLGPYGEDGDHPFHRLERGELAFADWVADLLRRAAEAGVELDLAKAGGNALDALRVQDEVVAEVRALRSEGYRTAVLTNNVREFAAWRDMLPLAELFDVVVDSSEVGMRKPSAPIYRLTLDRLGVPAARAVFLDDHPANVAGAQAVGMAAIHVTDAPTAITALRALLKTP